MPSFSALSEGHLVTSTLRLRRHAADIRATRLRVTLVIPTPAADPSDRSSMSVVRVELEAALSTRYLIESELGAGAAATVYLAHDLKHDRKVALKVLRPELAAVLGGERFLNEIRVTAQLSHPNIIPLYDSGDIEGYLFYTMPVIEGETLRQKLDREKQLAVDEAIALTCAVAEGLAYAHDHGIVHRDIKPENILLQRGVPVIADFGIATAIDRIDAEKLTATGLSLGTPTYMSPEMATHDRTVGPASDTYALATVLYEMLAGDPPFTGSNVRAIITRIVVEKPTRLRVVRATVPGHVDAAVARALAKVPADRFESVMEFAEALTDRPARVRPRWWLRRADMGLRGYATIRAGAVLLVVTAVSLATYASVTPPAYADSVYAVLSTSRSGISASHFAMLHRVLREWREIAVVPETEVRRKLDVDATLTPRSAARTAARLHAGSYIVGSAISLGDSLQLTVELFLLSDEGTPYRRTSRIIHASAPSIQAYRDIVFELLFGADASATIPRNATRSYAAQRAMIDGSAHLASWSLLPADSAFDAATRFDSTSGIAWLWLAQVRSWRRTDPAEWRDAANRAFRLAYQMGRADSTRAAAVLHLADRRTAAACDGYRQMTAIIPDDYTAWFGLGDCLSRDSTVVADRSVAGGQRFRASYNEQLHAYRTAFGLQPATHRAFRSDAYLAFQRLLYTRRDRMRSGRGIGNDATSYRSFPAWQGDSVVFRPYAAPLQPELGADNAVAMQHQRRVFYEIATGWRVRTPADPEALEAVGVALDVLGERTSLDTVAKARRLASAPDIRARIGSTEVWLRLKYALPDDTAQLRIARVLGDSLLQNDTLVNAEPAALATVASVLGRPTVAVSLMQSPRALRAHSMHPGIAASAVALVQYAAAGAPVDSIEVYEARVRSLMLGPLESRIRDHLESRWYARAAGLARPAFDFPGMASFAAGRNTGLQAHVALMRNDTAGAREAIDRASLDRREAGLLPGDLSIDVLMQEAYVLQQLGDNGAILRHVGPTLQQVAHMPIDAFTVAERAAPLLRLIAVYAQAASATGDHAEAKRWLTALRVLTQDDRRVQEKATRQR